MEYRYTGTAELRSTRETGRNPTVPVHTGTRSTGYSSVLVHEHVPYDVQYLKVLLYHVATVRLYGTAAKVRGYYLFSPAGTMYLLLLVYMYVGSY